MKKWSKYLAIILVVVFLLWLNDILSYSRRIGDTNFYLMETMSISKDGKTLNGLYYKPNGESGYRGEMTPGFPKEILWNNKYLIAKNFNGNDQKITCYVVIPLDSVDASKGVIHGMRKFSKESQYRSYLRQIGLDESKMNKTDNYILWR